MTARSLKILITDDHHIIRTGIRALLEARTGWHVCAEADNGEDAVKLVLSHLPDIAILDYSLPVLNGLEAARKVIAGSPTVSCTRCMKTRCSSGMR